MEISFVANPFRPLRKFDKIFNRFWHSFTKQSNDDKARIFFANCYIEIYLNIIIIPKEELKLNNK